VADAVKIHRVGLGGAPVVDYGSSPIVDPDAARRNAGRPTQAAALTNQPIPPSTPDVAAGTMVAWEIE
jgi:hypothetical protein